MDFSFYAVSVMLKNKSIHSSDQLSILIQLVLLTYLLFKCNELIVLHYNFTYTHNAKISGKVYEVKFY